MTVRLVVTERFSHGFGDALDDDGLLAGLRGRIRVHEHQDEVAEAPGGFQVLARSRRSPESAVEALAAPARRWWGTQFHPEDADDEHAGGETVLHSLFPLAGLRRDPIRPRRA